MDRAQQAVAFIENMESLDAQGAPIEWKEVCRRIKALLNTPESVPDSPDINQT